MDEPCSHTRTGPRSLALLAGMAPFLVAGCAVGPDFHRPAPPTVSRYTGQPLTTTVATAGTPGGNAQRFADGADIPGAWWTLFRSKSLDELIRQALKNNPDLEAAKAALRAAHESALAQRGAFLPALSGGFSATRTKNAATLAPVPSNNALQYDLFTPEVSVSYTPDVFGLNRRSVESADAQAQAARFQMIAVYNTLTANVVVTAIQLATTHAQVDATQRLVSMNAHMADILKYQFQKGYASGVDYAAQKSQLAQVAATLPPLVKQEAQLRNQLAVLAGRFPSQAPADRFELASLTLPEQIPVSLPSELVRQRPDIRQAEANLHAASAQIGIAVANRLPSIQLTADAGNMALAFDKLFTPGNGFWDMGAAVTAPLFEGGALLHQERAARAAYKEAAEQYRSTVLTAFQNVADTLTALEQDAYALKAAAAAEHAARTTLDLVQRQAKDGYANTLTLLNAEQTFQQAQINLVQAEAARYADTAALFQALGGGWWHRQDMNEERHDS